MLYTIVQLQQRTDYTDTYRGNKMTSLVLAVDKISLQNISNWIKGLIEKRARYRAYRNTIKELERLTDHELRDIGIHRGNIRSIAMEVYFDNRGDWV